MVTWLEIITYQQVDNSHKMKNFIGFFFTILCMVFLFNKINFSSITLTEVNYNYIALICILNITSFSLRSFRWHILVCNISEVKWFLILTTSLYAASINSIMPGRAGDFYRCNIIANKINKKFSAVLLTAGFDKICDIVVSFVLMLSYLTTFLSLIDKKFYSKLELLLYSPVMLLIFISLIITMRCYFSSLYQSVRQRIISIYQYFRRLSFFVYSQISFLTMVSLLLDIFSMYIMGIALGINLQISDYAILYIAILFSLLLPSTPGNIGTFHFAATYTLSYLGVMEALSLKYSFYMHLIFSYTVPMIGFIYFLATLLFRININKTHPTDEKA
jgi:uncharacterized protein (TIRG00374 family)